MPLFQIDHDGIAALAIDGQDNVHIATTGQTARNTNICLIQANEGSLGAGVRHFGAHATDRGRDIRQGRSAAEAGSKSKQEQLVGGVADAQGHGHKRIGRRTEL